MEIKKRLYFVFLLLPILFLILFIPSQYYTLRDNSNDVSEDYLKRLKVSLDRDPSNWEERYELGRAYMHKGMFQEAVNQLIGVLTFKPDDFKTLSLLGTLFYRKGDYKNARYYWTKALDVNPENELISGMLQNINFIIIPSKENMLKWREHHLKGDNYLQKNKYEEAIYELEEALRYNSNEIRTYFSLGTAYYNMGDIENAVLNWKKVKEIDPDNVMVTDLLRRLDVKKDMRKKINELKDSIKRNPDDWKYHFQLGSYYLISKNEKKAEREFKKVLKLNPSHMGSYQGLAVLSINRFDFETAAGFLKEALEKKPDDRVIKMDMKVTGGYAKILRDVKERKEKIDYNEMVYIPPGEFIMGDNDPAEEIGIDEKPLRRVYVDGFYIDKYEVTNMQYKKYVDATGHRPPSSWVKGNFSKYMTDFPVTYVNWFEASAYCRWSGKRLPSEEEWEKAARGEDGRRFPWGDAFDRNKANTRFSSFRKPVPVSAYPDGISPYGVYNMSGNVWEWTDSWYRAYPGSTLKRQEFGDIYKIQRGGSFLAEPLLHARASERDAQIPTYRHRTTGFRCAKDVR
ncbi:MAG: SUMF1/EgtB/PvdO family nonheme iron enzyme [Nitrospirota bacterium]